MQTLFLVIIRKYYTIIFVLLSFVSCEDKGKIVVSQTVDSDSFRRLFCDSLSKDIYYFHDFLNQTNPSYFSSYNLLNKTLPKSNILFSFIGLDIKPLCNNKLKTNSVRIVYLLYGKHLNSFTIYEDADYITLESKYTNGFYPFSAGCVVKKTEVSIMRSFDAQHKRLLKYMRDETFELASDLIDPNLIVFESYVNGNYQFEVKALKRNHSIFNW